MSRRPGRPAEAVLDLRAIAGAAADVLRAEGMEALSVRAVATRLGVTPMAVIARAGSRDGMVAAMLAEVFAGVAVGGGAAEARVVAGLESYAAAAMAAPGAVTLMLSRPELIPAVLDRFGAEIAAALAEGGMDAGAARRGRDILIDHGHGALIAAALAPAAARQAVAAEYRVAMRHLVRALFG